MSKYLDPKADLTFKKIFGQHPNLVMSLLNALLPLPDGMEIKSVEYLTAENIPNNPAKKYSIVDVKCTDNYNRHFIVEMQSYWTQEFFSRTVFNVTSVYANQLGKGVSFQELKDVYALSLVNEEAFCYDKDEGYIQEFYLINKKHTHDIRTNLALIFVELPKFKPENKGDKKMKELWMKFLTQINENTHKVDEELLQNPETRQALDIVEQSAYTDAELAAYQKYWLDISTEKSAILGAEKRGLAAGIEQGRAEGEKIGMEKGERNAMLATARNMKADGMSAEIIAKYTGLTSDEIAAL